jgi:hypothetical protein
MLREPMTAAHEPSKGSQREALLQVPSGRIAHRLSLDGEEPWEIAHEGYCWVWSHRCASGVTYARGRVVT